MKYVVNISTILALVLFAASAYAEQLCSRDDVCYETITYTDVSGASIQEVLFDARGMMMVFSSLPGPCSNRTEVPFSEISQSLSQQQMAFAMTLSALSDGRLGSVTFSFESEIVATTGQIENKYNADIIANGLNSYEGCTLNRISFQ